MANRTRITDEEARAFMPKDGREAVLWDGAAPGLGLRVRPNGRKTWIVHKRCAGSVVKRTLGPLDVLGAEEARDAARALISGARAGIAPAVPTVREFAPGFLADCAGRWKPATRRMYAHVVGRWILPAFGSRPLDALCATDVRNWYEAISAAHPASANWALAALSSMMKQTESLGLRSRDSNPCRGLRRRKTGFKARCLRDREFAALGRALEGARSDHPAAVAALRFLLYTGARKSEALGLEWQHVHGERAVLLDAKSGPRTIRLASPARGVLAARPRRTDCPWVFATPRGDPVRLDAPWKLVREAAGLDGLRIHDLRHAYAAVAAGAGEGLRVVAGLLGHAGVSTTFGYAHLAENSLAGAANRVSKRLAAMLDGRHA